MAGLFNYISDLSTTSIFYNDSGNGILRYLIWRPTPPISAPFAEIFDPSSTLLSSSRGLVIFRDPTFNYFICNPFIQDAYTFLPNPPRHHLPDSTHVVLATDLDVDPVFDVICAVRSDNNTYDFDVYSSITGQWFPMLEGINLGCLIVPESGVSCGRCVYWLTKTPCRVLKYSILGNEIISFIQLPSHLASRPQETWTFQLGRIGNSLGIAIADESLHSVQVSVLQATQTAGRYTWYPMGFLDMVRRADAIWDGTVRCDFPRAERTIVCRELPRAIRFESYKMEVLFWVDGRMALLESFNENPNVFTNQVSALPAYGVPACVERGLSIVCTSLHPGRLNLNQHEKGVVD